MYDKEEVKTHLNIITKYSNFIISLINKYIVAKINIRNKLIIQNLIYYTDEKLFIRLCYAFNFIESNFKNTNNFFLLDYICLRQCKMLSIDKICRSSLVRILEIVEIKNILETVLRSCNGSIADELFLEKIT